MEAGIEEILNGFMKIREFNARDKDFKGWRAYKIELNQKISIFLGYLMLMKLVGHLSKNGIKEFLSDETNPSLSISSSLFLKIKHYK